MLRTMAVTPNAAASTKDQAQPAPRPRLVAKTASGQRASAPKPAHAAYKNGKGTGPDPLQVWNRNRRMQKSPSCLNLFANTIQLPHLPHRSISLMKS